jgi:hypothetical protein
MPRPTLAGRRFSFGASLLLVAALALTPWSPLRPAVAQAASTTKVQVGAEVLSATGNVAVTLPAASTAGNLLVAVVLNGGGTSSLPFSGPTGWVFAVGFWRSGMGRGEIWYYANNPGGVTSAAFTSSSTSIGALGEMSEWSGAAASGVLDTTGTTTVAGATSMTVSTSASTTVSGDLGITAFGTTVSETSFTAGSGWTHLYSDAGNRAGASYKQALPVATASDQETAAPNSAGWLGVIATFKPVQVPGPVTGLSATAGADRATISWTAPVTGGPVSSYVITALSGGAIARNMTAVPGTTTTVTMTGLAGGTAYKFSVFGVNSAGSGATTTTASSVTPTGATHPYTYSVLSDSPTFYYRLDESGGTSALDSSGNGSAGTEMASPTQGSAGQLATDTDTGLALNGSSQYVYGNTSYVNPTTFSIEAWFKTTTASGGRIVGFGSLQTGNSANYDRQIYMSNAGQLYFGVRAGAVKTINSAAAYNNGSAHHVVATLSSAGMFLYVDGSQVASDSTTTTAQNYTGYWRAGEDNLATWTNAPTSYYFNGTIDEVAVYPAALSLQRVQVHYCGGANSNCLSITLPSAVGFPGLTIDGNDHTVTATAAFDVVDNTGGDGWKVTGTSTLFASGSHSLASTAATVGSSPTTSCDAGFTCTLPTNSVSYPYTLPAGGSPPTATNLFNAVPNTGQGHATATLTFTLTVPGNAYAGSYASVWTFSVVSGP